MMKTPIPDTHKTIRVSIQDLLIFLKTNHTYRELSKITNLPIATLARYAKGRIEPSYERAMELYKLLTPHINEQLKSIIEKHKIEMLFHPTTLNLIATKILFDMSGTRITKILTFENMTPLATATSMKMNVPFITITKTVAYTHKKYICLKFLILEEVLTYYIPISNIKKHDDILYIDVNTNTIKENIIEKIKNETKTNIIKYILSDKIK